MDGNLITLIANTGFAIGIATYLVYWMVNRLDKTLNYLTEAIQKQTIILKELKEMLGEKKRWY